MHAESAFRTGGDRTLNKPYSSRSKALFVSKRSSPGTATRKPEAKPVAFVDAATTDAGEVPFTLHLYLRMGDALQTCTRHHKRQSRNRTPKVAALCPRLGI